MDLSPKLPKWVQKLHDRAVAIRNDFVTVWAEHGVTLGKNSSEIGRLLDRPHHAELAALYTQHGLDDFVPKHVFGPVDSKAFLREAAQLGPVQEAAAARIHELLKESSTAITQMADRGFAAARGAQGADQSMRMMAETKRLLGDRRVMSAFAPHEAERIAKELTGTMAQEFDAIQRVHRKLAKGYIVEESPVTKLIDTIRNATTASHPASEVPISGARPMGAAARESKIFATPSAGSAAHTPISRNGLLVAGALAGAAVVAAVVLNRPEKSREPDWQARMRMPQTPQQRSA